MYMDTIYIFVIQSRQVSEGGAISVACHVNYHFHSYMERILTKKSTVDEKHCTRTRYGVARVRTTDCVWYNSLICYGSLQCTGATVCTQTHQESQGHNMELSNGEIFYQVSEVNESVLKCLTTPK